MPPSTYLCDFLFPNHYRYDLHYWLSFSDLFSYRTMALDSINPLGDPRIKHCYANLNGIQYRMCLLSLK